MVQTKQPSLVAPAMGSRSNSAQVLPKKKATVTSHPAPPKIYMSPPTPYADSSTKPPQPATPSSSSPSKVSKKKKRKGSENAVAKSEPAARSSFFPYFLVLLAFYLYGALVCPADDPVCKGWGALQDDILQPYVMPHIRSVRADPRVRYVENHVLFPAYEHTIVPFSEHVVQPFYADTLVPFYDHTLHPRLRPYTKRVHLYVLRLRKTTQPYIKQMSAYYDAVLPYLQAAWQHVKVAYSHLEPHLIATYRVTLPYAEAAYAQLVLILADARLKVVELRRVYVDPHVEKIWDKIIEGK